ncbi:oxaloacetate decarboxylase alpha subunit [compost metagenome]
MLAHPAFASAKLDTGFIPRYQTQLQPEASALPAEFWQLAGEAFAQGEPARHKHEDFHSPWTGNSGWRAGLPAEIDLHLACNGERQVIRLRHSAPATTQLCGERLLVELDGVRRQHLAIRRGETLYLEYQGELHAITRVDPIAEVEASHSHHGGLSAPMNGSIVRVLVQAGQTVEAGTALVVLEAMKMEHSIRAPHAGVVKALYCGEGEMVGEGSVLVELEEV